MPRRIKVDGKTIVVPDDATDSEINQLAGPAPSRVAGLPAGMELPGPPGRPAVNMQTPQGVGGTIGTHLANMISGPYHAFTDTPRNPEEENLVESHGGINTKPNSVLSPISPEVNPIVSGLNRVGLGMNRMFVQPTEDALRESSQLRNAGGPQSSLLAPSHYSAEGENVPTAGSKLIDAIPVLGPWARSYSDEANRSGILPATAGLLTDAVAPELAAGVLGKIRDAAPSMAEGAMGIRRGDRGYGKTPGRAILDETSGVRPTTVGSQAQAALNELNPLIDDLAANYSGRVDTTPAADRVQADIDTAITRNNGSGAQALQPVKDTITTNQTNGLPLSPNQTATGALNLKRGLRDAFVKNWSPDAASILTRDAAKSASGVLDSQLDDALGPQFQDTNQRISSLIPVADAAEKLSRADDLPQRFGDKLRAHTGALTSALGGALAGGHAGGLLGAIGGGTLGFALPELLGGPTAKMAIARGMDSPLPSALIPPLFTGGILAPKKGNQ